MAGDAITAAVTVETSPDEAFAVFFDRFADWWPREFTWSQDALATVAVEPREGGRAFERGPDAFHIDWGRVREVERPRRALFTWQISPRCVPVPDPARASEVEVRFEQADGGRTRVELEHRGFSRHREGADEYRHMMGEQGWPYALGRFAEADRLGAGAGHPCRVRPSPRATPRLRPGLHAPTPRVAGALAPAAGPRPGDHDRPLLQALEADEANVTVDPWAKRASAA